MFCLNSEIIDAIRSVDFNARLRSIDGIEIVRDDDGEVVYFTGNSVVVVRVMHNGEPKSMRCYRGENPYLKEIYQERSYRAELRIDKGGSTEKFVDIVLCDWVEGVTLDSAVRRCLAQRGKDSGYRDGGSNATRRLSTAFDAMASDILKEEWAHGDISLDNIIVKSDGSMQLVDFDTMYVPSLEGRNSLSLGTPQFQPATRTVQQFNKRIDDFSLMLISVALRALSEDVWLRKKYSSEDLLLIDGQRVGEKDYEPLRDMMQLFASKGLFAHYRMAKLLSLCYTRAKHLSSIFDFALGRNCSEIPISQYKIFRDDCGAEGYYYEERNKILIPALFDEALNFERVGKEGESDVYLAEVAVGDFRFLIDKDGRIKKLLNNIAEDWDRI